MDTDEAIETIEMYCREINDHQTKISAGDELLAQVLGRSTRKTVTMIKNFMTETYQEGGLYDYRKVEALLSNIDYSIGNHKDAELLRKKAREILIDGYEKMIEKGILCINKLIEKGYSDASISAKLLGKPINHWENIVKKEAGYSETSEVIEKFYQAKPVEIDPFWERYHPDTVRTEAPDGSYATIADLLPPEHPLLKK